MGGRGRGGSLLLFRQLRCLPLLLVALLAAPALALPKQKYPVCNMAAPCTSKCTKRCGNATASPFVELPVKDGFFEPMASLVKRVVAAAEAQAAATVKKSRPDEYPYSFNEKDGWTYTEANHWTSGFFPGVLWQLYNLTGKPEWKGHAERWTTGLANLQRDWSLQHDYGFVYLPSFGEAYKATKSEESKLQVLGAAQATAWAFNPATNATRTFEGWDPPGSTRSFRQPVIMDHIMNIEVLLEGARLGGPRDWLSSSSPQDWVDMALAHARTVAKNHVRPDGSSYHIVEYHPTRGTVNKRYTYQGYADNSTWARGQAWAMAGFAMMYAETGKAEFKAVAEKVADRWLELLGTMEGPAQGGWVPNWDFNAPYEPQFNGPMDTSAAAVAALAFLRLAEHQPSDSPCGRRYLCAGINTLRSLTTSQYMAPLHAEGSSLLLHATGNRPGKLTVDEGLVFGDYYLLEALEVCRRMPGCIGAR